MWGDGNKFMYVCVYACMNVCIYALVTFVSCSCVGFCLSLTRCALAFCLWSHLQTNLRTPAQCSRRRSGQRTRTWSLSWRRPRNWKTNETGYCMYVCMVYLLVHNYKCAHKECMYNIHVRMYVYACTYVWMNDCKKMTISIFMYVCMYVYELFLSILTMSIC